MKIFTPPAGFIAATMRRGGRLWMHQAAVHSCVKIEYNSESRHAPLVNT
jgi:hypothetical protein